MEYVFENTGKTKIIEKKQFKLEKYCHCYASVWPEYNITQVSLNNTLATQFMVSTS